MTYQIPVSLLIANERGRRRDLTKELRRPGRMALVLMTIFLPIVLVHTWAVPTRPGSRWTMGMAIVGFLATLSLGGALAGLLTTTWLLVGVCLYWFVGTSLLALEYRRRGFDV
jgi:hypothetical protein